MSKYHGDRANDGTRAECPHEGPVRAVNRGDPMATTLSNPAMTAEERAAIIEAVREFAQTELEPNAIEWDERSHFPRDVLQRAGELGIGGITVREQSGGTGLARVDAAAVYEELAKGDPAVASYISIHNM